MQLQSSRDVSFSALHFSVFFIEKKEGTNCIYYTKYTVTRKFPVNSNGRIERLMCNFYYLLGLLLLTQPLNSSEQHTRANLEFSSNFDKI